METETSKVANSNDLVLEEGEDFHLRADVDYERKVLRFGVFEDGVVKVVTLYGVTPFMGHRKTHDCCVELAPADRSG